MAAKGNRTMRPLKDAARSQLFVASSFSSRRFSRFAVIAAALLFLLWEERSLIAQPQPNDDSVKFAAELQGLLLDGKYRELNSIAERLRKERPLLASGRSQLTFFYSTLSRGGGDTREAQLRGVQDRISQVAGWVEASDNLTSRLTLIGAVIAQGWLQRGTDYANRVSDEAMENFTKSLTNAERLLKETESIALKSAVRDPELYRLWMSAGIGLGYDRQRMMTLLDKALDCDPWYEPAIEQMVNYLRPQWFGETGDIPRLAEHVFRKTKATIGEAGYATVAISAFGIPDYDEFSENGLSWKRTRAGLRERLKRSGDSIYLLSQLLKFGRLADDRETAAEAAGLLRGRWSTGIFIDAEDFLRAERWSSPDFQAGSARAILEGFRGPVVSVAFVEQGSAVVGVARKSRLPRFRVDNGIPLEPWNTSLHSPELSAAEPDGSRVLLAGFQIGNQTALVSLDTNDDETEIGLGTLPSRSLDLVVDKQGQYFALSLASGSIRRWKQGDVPQPFEWKAGHSSHVWGLAFSPDGTQLASVGGYEIVQWDLAKRTEIRRWKCHDEVATTVAWSPDGQTLATAGSGNEIRLWNAATGERTGELVGGNTSIGSLAFSSDGRRLVGATRSWEQLSIPGEIVVWGMPDKTRLATLTGHALGIWKIVISPDNKTIASASSDGTIRLWDLP